MSKKSKIQIKRAYDAAAPGDGRRFLVDHLWPRGIKKEKLKIESWLRSVSPSDKLRNWFKHDPEKWSEFQRRYHAELDKKPETWQPLVQAAKTGAVTLVFGARDVEHNNAVALKAYLDKKI
ncbi:MAG TPA: DUF488 family protein [Phycisphaerae bacterium]|nr:DUF488 family protein [Phycisphaerae bacterium]